MQPVKSVAPAGANSWVKPELVRLGQIADVAGSVSLNFNGASVNLKS